jgi:hypothetical protein
MEKERKEVIYSRLESRGKCGGYRVSGEEKMFFEGEFKGWVGVD